MVRKICRKPMFFFFGGPETSWGFWQSGPLWLKPPVLLMGNPLSAQLPSRKSPIGHRMDASEWRICWENHRTIMNYSWWMWRSTPWQLDDTGGIRRVPCSLAKDPAIFFRLPGKFGGRALSSGDMLGFCTQKNLTPQSTASQSTMWTPRCPAKD